MEALFWLSMAVLVSYVSLFVVASVLSVSILCLTWKRLRRGR